MYSSVNYFLQNNDEPVKFDKVNDSEIIKINNDLDGILSNLKGYLEDDFEKEFKLCSKIELPKLVVVGGQSSGKSSVLNNIITFNILPMGKNMVTRTPLCIQLTQSNERKVEFGNYDENIWQPTKSIILNNPYPNEFQLDSISNEIERLTGEIAGPGKNISFKQITIKVFSPDVPNLTLIDLPGLTNVACTDEGQPEDIKIQIENLIKEYIKSDKTIILAVMPARSDLEADMGLGLIKQIDKKFDRTLGIITKVDLMNEDTSVAKYLQPSKISIDLRLKYGYFIVKNRSNNELKTISIKDGIKKENEYFLNHKIYSKLSDDLKKRITTNNLKLNLTEILVKNIKDNMPQIMQQITKLLNYIDKQLLIIGPELPDNIKDKSSLLNMLIIDFCKKFTGALEERHCSINIGRKIKDCFTNYKNIIKNLDPFTEKNCPDDYINNAIKNCEGNHMSFLLPPIEVIEYCIKDQKKSPIQILWNPTVDCLNSVINELKNLINIILQQDNFARFPKFVAKLESCIELNILEPYKKITLNHMNCNILKEETYIWTDESIFMDKWKSLLNNSTNQLKPENIRGLLQVYFQTIINTTQNNIPKDIMFHLIKNMADNISKLFDILHYCSPLLTENPDTTNKRKILGEFRDKIVHVYTN
jgi:GTP-binding protein EngB required for normal cell division